VLITLKDLGSFAKCVMPANKSYEAWQWYYVYVAGDTVAVCGDTVAMCGDSSDNGVCGGGVAVSAMP
jgi:hypothetical protein